MGLTFKSLEQANRWRLANRDFLQGVQEQVESIPGIAYAEAWLCEHEPSHIAGYDNADIIVVCKPIPVTC